MHFQSYVKMRILSRKLYAFQLSKLMTTVALFLSTAISSSIARAGFECRNIFDDPKAHELSQKIIANEHHALGHEIQIFDLPTVSIVDGFKAKKLINNPGYINDGIFFFNRDRAKRVLKLYELTSPMAFAKFSKFLSGVAYGTETAGPKLYSFGTAKTQDGTLYLYMELEEVFAGEKKLIAKDWIDNPHITKREISYFRNPEFIKNFARSIVALAEAKIFPHDPDFMVSLEGEMRWFDSDYWQPVENLNEFRIEELVKDLQSIDLIASKFIRIELEKQIRDSKLSPHEKTILLEKI